MVQRDHRCHSPRPRTGRGSPRSARAHPGRTRRAEAPAGPTRPKAGRRCNRWRRHGRVPRSDGTRSRTPDPSAPPGRRPPSRPIVLRLVLAVEPALDLITGGGDAEQEVVVEPARAAATGGSRLVQLSAAGRVCAAARGPRRRSRPRRWPAAPALAVGARSRRSPRPAPPTARRGTPPPTRPPGRGPVGSGARAQPALQTQQRVELAGNGAQRPADRRELGHRRAHGLGVGDRVLGVVDGDPHAASHARSRAQAHLLGGPAGAVVLAAGRRDAPRPPSPPASPDGRARCASGAAHRRGRRERPRSGPARRGPRR